MRLPDRLTLPVLFAALLLATLLAGGLGYATASPARHDTFTASAAPPEPVFVRGIVQNTTADRLTLLVDGAPRDLTLRPDLKVEAQRPAPIASVAPGAWINAAAVPHQQTIFALTGLVLLPAGAFQPSAR